LSDRPNLALHPTRPASLVRGRAARMRLIWAVLLMVMCNSALSAQSLAGDWQGTLSGTRPLRLVVHIERADGAMWKATLASIDQSPDWGATLPADSVAVQGVLHTSCVECLHSYSWHRHLRGDKDSCDILRRKMTNALAS
jgi:hypothetical protein